MNNTDQQNEEPIAGPSDAFNSVWVESSRPEYRQQPAVLTGYKENEVNDYNWQRDGVNSFSELIDEPRILRATGQYCCSKIVRTLIEITAMCIFGEFIYVGNARGLIFVYRLADLHKVYGECLKKDIDSAITKLRPFNNKILAIVNQSIFILHPFESIEQFARKIREYVTPDPIKDHLLFNLSQVFVIDVNGLAYTVPIGSHNGTQMNNHTCRNSAIDLGPYNKLREIATADSIYLIQSLMEYSIFRLVVKPSSGRLTIQVLKRFWVRELLNSSTKIRVDAGTLHYSWQTDTCINFDLFEVKEICRTNSFTGTIKLIEAFDQMLFLVTEKPAIEVYSKTTGQYLPNYYVSLSAIFTEIYNYNAEAYRKRTRYIVTSMLFIGDTFVLGTKRGEILTVVKHNFEVFCYQCPYKLESDVINTNWIKHCIHYLPTVATTQDEAVSALNNERINKNQRQPKSEGESDVENPSIEQYKSIKAERMDE